jgi:hypothetical protein
MSSMATRTTKFYAEYCPYGITALNTNGPRANKLIVFPTRSERDAWVAADPQHRESLSASANKVRAAVRFEQRMGYAVIISQEEFEDR